MAHPVRADNGRPVTARGRAGARGSVSLILALAGSVMLGAQVRALLDAGTSAFETGRFEAAARSFAEVPARAPDGREAVTASFLEALSLFYAGDATAARQRLEAHRRRFSDSPYDDQIWYWIGAAALADGDAAASLAALERHLHQPAGSARATPPPFAVQAWDTRARALERLGRTREALELYERLLAGEVAAAGAAAVDGAARARWLARAGALLLEAERYTAAAERYRRIVTEFPSTPAAPEALFFLAEAEYFAGDAAAAAVRYERYLEYYPGAAHRVAAGYRLTRIALETGDPAGAHGAWRRLAAEPAAAAYDPVALAALAGDVHAAGGDWTGAAAAYRAGLAADPTSRQQQVLALNLAVALVGNGSPAQAAAVFRRAAEGPDPALAETASYRHALLLVRQGRLEEGAAVLARFLDRYPGSVRAGEAEGLLIEVRQRTGDHQALLQTLDRLARRRRLTPAEEQRRGLALLRVGDASAALAALASSASALPAPAQAESRYAIGAVYGRRGEHARAAPYFAAVHADPAAALELRQRAAYALAITHFNVGEYDAALEVLGELTGDAAAAGAGAAGRWRGAAEFATAAAFYRLGRVEEAARHFDRAAAAAGGEAAPVAGSELGLAAAARSWGALALLQSGALEPARALLRELASASSSALHWYRAGLASGLLEDYAAAEREFAAALAATEATDPLRAEILYEVARLHLARGDPAAAEDALGRLERAASGQRLAAAGRLLQADTLRDRGLLRAAAAAYQALAERMSRPDARGDLELAELARFLAIEALADADGPVAALDHAWEYLTRDPGAVRTARVAALLRAGLVAAPPATARKFYSRVRAARTGAAQPLPPVLIETVHLAYAEVWLAQEPARSERLLRALLTGPHSAGTRLEASLLLGRAYEGMRRWQQAADLYAGLASSEETAVAARGALGVARVLALAGDPAAAAQEYEAVAIRFEELPEVAGEAWFRGAAAHRAAGNLEAAARFTAQLRARLPDSGWARRARGEVEVGPDP